MNQDAGLQNATLDVASLERIEAACLDFEAAWKRSDAPRIEDFLYECPAAERCELLRELLLLELDYQTQSGQSPVEEQLLARFSSDSQLVSEVFGSHKALQNNHSTQKLTIRIRCPHCQQSMEVDNEHNQETLKCPACDGQVSLTDDQSLGLSKGAVVGHFELLEQLGIGAFGEVWRARDLQLDRMVAIKLPRNQSGSPGQTSLLLREAKAAANLHHPGIVSIHEVGQQDGWSYIVSDYVDGVDLATTVQSGPLIRRDAVELCVKIADALQHAHERGVVHRDLKPANIIWGCDGEPRVMDFGLAKREASEVTMTLQGQVLGTPAYMSPEQAQGDGHAADCRSDIYSLGVILYELLTGERPFRGTQQALLSQIVHDEPPSPRRFSRSIPRDLETICLKCLEKSPELRYATASDFAADLNLWLQGKPITARPIGPVRRLWRWYAPRAMVVAGACTLFTGLFVALGILGTTTAINALTEQQSGPSPMNEMMVSALVILLYFGACIIGGILTLKGYRFGLYLAAVFFLLQVANTSLVLWSTWKWNTLEFDQAVINVILFNGIPYLMWQLVGLALQFAALVLPAAPRRS